MTYEEVQEGLIELMKDPAKADAVKTNEFLDKLRADYLDKESFSEKLKKKEDEITALKDRAAYYAQLAVARQDVTDGGRTVQEEEEEENPMQTPDDLDRFLAETAANDTKEDK